VSLQNTLELCAEALRAVPPYGHREVVALVASLSSVDPGDVRGAIKACKDLKIRCGRAVGPGGGLATAPWPSPSCSMRCRSWRFPTVLRPTPTSPPHPTPPHPTPPHPTPPHPAPLPPRSVSIVGVSAEVHIFRRTTEETGGGYGVALSEQHLADLLLAHAAPPPAPPGAAAAELVRMGFPQRGAEDPAGAVFVGEAPELLPGGYTCPRCKARTAELPCKCHVCGLTLISSPHLARSYHHLFPVQVGGGGGGVVAGRGLCAPHCLQLLAPTWPLTCPARRPTPGPCPPPARPAV
jgi:hypothetical protein